MIRNISLGWSLNPKHNLILSMFVTYKIFLGGKLQISWSETKHGKFHGNSPRFVQAPGLHAPNKPPESTARRLLAADRKASPAVGVFGIPGEFPDKLTGPKRNIIVFQPSFLLGFHVQFCFVFQNLGNKKEVLMEMFWEVDTNDID